MSYDHRITLAVPEAFISDANNLAACVGLSHADLNTFTEASWQDAQGNLYSVCSAQVTDRVLSFLGGALVRPEWDAGQQISMAAANRALALITTEGLATPESIRIVIDMDGLQALESIGLAPVTETD